MTPFLSLFMLLQRLLSVENLENFSLLVKKVLAHNVYTVWSHKFLMVNTESSKGALIKVLLPKTLKRNKCVLDDTLLKYKAKIPLTPQIPWCIQFYHLKNVHFELKQNVELNLNSAHDSQQVGGGSLKCLEFGDSKLSSVEGCTGKKCPCPCQHGKETPDTPEVGKITRQLSPQSINTVVAFSVVSPEIKQAIDSVKYIAENMRSRNKAKEVSHYFHWLTVRMQHRCSRAADVQCPPKNTCIQIYISTFWLFAFCQIVVLGLSSDKNVLFY